MYIADGMVIVKNEIEDRCFIYDKNNILKYKINEDMFTLMKYIDNNPSLTYEQLCGEFNEIEEVILFLRERSILQIEIPNYHHKIKEISNFNSARLFVECTDKCNLSCPHCYGSFGKNNRHFISVNKMEAILKHAVELNVYEVDITGGEPFLHPDLEGILELLYKYGMITTLFTNLTVCSEKELLMLKRYGIKTVITSIESYMPDVHDKFRGATGAWKKTKNNIEFLKELGIEVKVNFVLGNHNILNAEETINFICDLGVCCNVDFTTPEGRAENGEYDLGQAIKILRKYNDNSIVRNCGVAKRMLFISASGDIYPCPSIRENMFLLGNINEKYDLQVAFSKTFTLLTNFVCNQDCGVKECSGGCRARALKFHGELEKPDDYFCKMHGDKYKCTN